MTDQMMPKKQLLLIAIVLSIFLIAGGFLYYRSEEKTIREEKYDELHAIAELKTAQITQWLKERKADAAVISESPFFISGIEEWLDNRNNLRLKEDITERLIQVRDKFGYEDILLASPQGELHFSLDPKINKFDPATSNKIIEAVKKQTITFTDFYFCSTHNTVHIDIIAPVVNEKNTSIAALVFRIDPKDYLYPLIQSWPTPSDSAETLIVRRDDDSVVFINELRHKKNTALLFRIPLTEKDVPAVKAVTGITGIIEGKDYRGIDVLADVSHVPGTSWYMIAKVDKKEIFSKLRYRGVVTSLFTALLLILVGTGIAWFYHSRQKDIYKELFLKEKALRETQEEFRTTLYSIGDAVITTDTQGVIHQMNPVAEQLTGWNESDAKGKPLEEVFKILNEQTRSKTINTVQRVLKEGVVFGLANHTLLISKDGKEIPIADSGSPVRNEKGDIIGVVLVFHDQTEERTALKRLTESEQRFRMLYEQSPAPYQSLDEEGNILAVNNAWLETLGYEKSEVIGKWFGDFLAGDAVILFNEQFPEFKSLGEVHGIEFEMKRKDGETIVVSFEGGISCDKKGSFLQTHCVFTNITERKRAEEVVKKIAVEWQTTFDSTKELFMLLDKDYKIIRANRATREFLGMPFEKIIGNYCFKLIHGTDEPITECPLARLRKSQAHEESEIFIKERNLWLSVSVDPIFNQKGELVQVVHIIEDITARKLAEEEIQKLNAELEQRVKKRTAQLEVANKELESFSYSVSHDLKAPLRHIIGFVELLKDRTIQSLDKESLRYMNIISHSIDKMGTLIDDILSFSRMSRAEMMQIKVNPNELVKEAINTLKAETEGRDIIWKVDQLPEVYGDPAMLRLVFVNLISNALKFTRKQPQARIEIGCTDNEKELLFFVRDNGVGFDMEYAKKLFGLFQRLHREEEFEGTGIGLANFRRIIQRHGGRTWAEGKVDEGATFYFSLPRQDNSDTNLSS